ncbi:MAG TPA: PAS domain S-box protein [Gemmataceae bacterium]|nr:PAS domain S-box protein [Gemmataceae bacterium]
MTNKLAPPLNQGPPAELPAPDGLTYQEAEAILQQLARAAQADLAPEPLLRQRLEALAQVQEVSAAEARERRHMEARLRKAEARFRTLVESIPVVTFMASLDESVNELYVSPQIEMLLGFTQKEWLENPVLWYEQLHPDDRDRWHAEFARTCATGERFRSEYRFLARDGRVVWVHGEAQVVRDADGRPLFMQGIAYDITESKRAEQTLRELNEMLEQRVRERTAAVEQRSQQLHDSEARTRAVLETAVDAILTIDERGLIQSVNPAAERMFGYRAHELLGQNVNLLMPSPYREEHDSYLANYLRTGVKKIIGIGREAVGRRKDGTTFPIDLAVSEVHVAGGRVFTGIVRDISERKRAEDQLRFYAAELQQSNADLLRSNQALDEFAYVASHDLKEPLRGISSYAGFLLEDYADKLDDEGRAKLETLQRLARRLEDLIDALLEFSRVGRVDLAVQPTDLNEVLAGVLDSLRISLQQRGVAVRIPRPLPVVRCDRARIGEVFRNLITNALKYNDKPEKWVEIGYREGAEGGPPVFYVRDNGIGIREKHFDAIFRIFKRLHGRDQFGGGTGAGLTIVKKIVERHGGRVWVESVYGEGTTFSFTLQGE